MKENSSYFVNSMNQGDDVINKDDLFFDRQNERVNKTPINSMNEIELFNLITSTDPDDETEIENVYQQANFFYSKKSILDNVDINEVINFVFKMIYNESPSYIKYGMKCFIAIFCQNTYSWDEDFAELILVVLRNHFNNDDQTIIQCILHIAANISGNSKKLTPLVFKHVDINYLNQIIKDEDINNDIKDKALCILGHYCFSLPEIPDELINMVCELAAMIIEIPEIEKLHQSIIYCCALIAKRINDFPDIFREYSLFQSFNQILTQSHSGHTKFYILKIAQYLYRSSIDYDEIDLNIIFRLINHTNSTIQSTSIQCLSEIIRSNSAAVDILIKMEIFPEINNIFENGSHKAKIYCIELLSLIFQSEPNSMTQLFIEQDYVNTFLQLIQVTSENSKSLEILLIILTEMNRITRNNGKGDEFDDLIKNSGACDQLFDLTDLNSNVSELAEIFLSETDL